LPFVNYFLSLQKISRYIMSAIVAVVGRPNV